MASVVGKTIFSDGKGKLFFGYYKDNDAVEFVDYKTWKKLSFKDVSKGDTNKQRVIKAILKNQKQFNKKVEFNMWAKQKKRTFEETMDWFIQNGWISNVTKRGIKESVDVLSVNEESINEAKIYKVIFAGMKEKDAKDFFTMVDKSPKIKAMTRDSGVFKVGNEVTIRFGVGSKQELELIKKVAKLERLKIVKIDESVNESASKEAMGIAGFTGTRGSAVEDFITKNELNGKKLFNFIRKGSLKDRMDFVTAIAGNPGNPIQKKIIKMFGESVNEGILQDREKQLKNLKQGGSVSGGGYGPFKKTGRNTFKSPKGVLSNAEALIKLIGGFSDFKVNEDKEEVEKIKKQVGNNEIKFYDALSKVEKRLGSKYPKFLDTALKQLKQNPSKFKTNADKEEAIFQSVK
jgi:hypothetical protein